MGNIALNYKIFNASQLGNLLGETKGYRIEVFCLSEKFK